MSSKALHRVPGVIVYVQPYGEADLILRAITPIQGKVALIAKAARKSKRRFPSPPDLFNCGELEFTRGRGNLDLLLGFKASERFLNLSSSLESLSYASILCEAFDFLSVEELQHDAAHLYELLRRGLREINSKIEVSDMRNICKAVLEDALELGGFSEYNLAAARADSLEHTLGRIEAVAERELKSKRALAYLTDFRLKSIQLKAI